ncbi:hypothetical protein GCM10010413_14340 [Promicromonospora sukumoe]
MRRAVRSGDGVVSCAPGASGVPGASGAAAGGVVVDMSRFYEPLPRESTIFGDVSDLERLAPVSRPGTEKFGETGRRRAGHALYLRAVPAPAADRRRAGRTPPLPEETT